MLNRCYVKLILVLLFLFVVTRKEFSSLYILCPELCVGLPASLVIFWLKIVAMRCEVESFLLCVAPFHKMLYLLPKKVFVKIDETLPAHGRAFPKLERTPFTTM